MEFLTIEHDAFSDIRHGREKVFQQHVNDNDNHEGYKQFIHIEPQFIAYLILLH